MAQTPPEFEGWATYPSSMSLLAGDGDTKEYGRRLAQAEKSLFVDETKEGMEIEVLQLGSPRQDGLRDAQYATIESTAELAALSVEPCASWAFFLFQDTSWDALQVSAEFFKKLFSFLRVRPEFIDIVVLFGEKATPVEQAFSSFFSYCRPVANDGPTSDLGCGYDFGYNIKYAAPHGRRLRDPFSVRETGVYHSYDAQTEETKWVFLQASESLQDRVREFFSRPAESRAELQVRVHGMVFQAASHGWRDYLVYLEDTFSAIVTRGFYSDVKGPRFEGDFEVDYTDIRRLQLLVDKLEQLLQVLQRNMDVGGEFCCFLERAQRLSPARLSGTFDETASIVHSCLLQHRIHSSRVQSLLARARGCGILVQSILNMQATESSSQINRAIRDLAEKNARETRSMSIVALISAIFLPAMFLATLFGTNFFDYESGKLHIASNFWIYIVIAIGMSAGTVALWLVYQRKRKSTSLELRHRNDMEAGTEK